MAIDLDGNASPDIAVADFDADGTIDLVIADLDLDGLADTFAISRDIPAESLGEVEGAGGSVVSALLDLLSF